MGSLLLQSRDRSRPRPNTECFLLTGWYMGNHLYFTKKGALGHWPGRLLIGDEASKTTTFSYRVLEEIYPKSIAFSIFSENVLMPQCSLHTLQDQKATKLLCPPHTQFYTQTLCCVCMVVQFLTSLQPLTDMSKDPSFGFSFGDSSAILCQT